jgi:hypothetical protein
MAIRRLKRDKLIVLESVTSAHAIGPLHRRPYSPRHH